MNRSANWHHFPAGPLQNVWLENGFRLAHDPVWGATIEYDNLPQLSNRLLAAVLLKSARFDATEILYLRLKLDLPQSDCARLLGTGEQTLSLWERGKHPIPVSSETVLRRLAFEELRGQLPKGFRFPRLIDMASNIKTSTAGTYLARYAEDSWFVVHDQPAARAKNKTQAEPMAA